MHPPRFFCPLPLAAGGSVDLPREAGRHAARVLRLAAGDVLSLFNGEGGEFDALIQAVAGDRVSVQVLALRAVERESPLAVTLAQALCPAEKMDLIVQKAVELGAACIQPLACSRSVARLDAARAQKRLAHWRGVAIAACEQCGRNRVPEVHPVAELHRWLGSPGRGTGLKLILSPAAERTLDTLRGVPPGVELLVGPEGGFSAEEEASAVRAGFQPLRLGPRVLRAETAGLAALAALQALWGDL